MIWNLVALRTTVKRLYGDKQLDLLRPCLYSVVYRENYAAYHFQEALKRLQRVVGGESEESLLIGIFDPDSTKSDKHHKNQFEAGAHALACVQSMHAVADTLAHVIYYSLGMNLGSKTSMNEVKISIANVKHQLSKVSGGDKLKVLVNDLTSHEDHKYISDLVNHSKHRHIVRSVIQIDMTGGNNHGLVFTHFERDSKPIAQRRIDAVLESEFARQSRCVVDIGCALNNQLGIPAAEVS